MKEYKSKLLFFRKKGYSIISNKEIMKKPLLREIVLYTGQKKMTYVYFYNKHTKEEWFKNISIEKAKEMIKNIKKAKINIKEMGKKQTKQTKYKMKSQKKTNNQKESLFNDEKLLKDLVLIYIGYTYIDADLKAHKYVGVNNKDEVYLTEKAKQADSYVNLKKMFNTQRMAYNAMLTTGVRFNNLKGKILTERVQKELNNAFGGKDVEIIAIYLGLLALFTYKDQVKNKKIFLNVDTQFLADLINDLNDKYWRKNEEFTILIDKCENIVDKLFENLYKNESWFS